MLFRFLTLSTTKKWEYGMITSSSIKVVIDISSFHMKVLICPQSDSTELLGWVPSIQPSRSWEYLGSLETNYHPVLCPQFLCSIVLFHSHLSLHSCSILPNPGLPYSLSPQFSLFSIRPLFTLFSSSFRITMGMLPAPLGFPGGGEVRHNWLENMAGFW